MGFIFFGFGLGFGLSLVPGVGLGLGVGEHFGNSWGYGYYKYGLYEQIPELFKIWL